MEERREERQGKSENFGMAGRRGSMARVEGFAAIKKRKNRKKRT